jgi:hypothetical protein
VTASFADNEIWHVLIASDDMKRMNVDQLDDAFRLDLVDASTMVWKAGMKTWQRLGSIADLGDEEPEDSVTRMRQPAAPPPPPRPLARPVPKPPSPSRVPASFHTAVTPVFAAPMLVSPVFTPTLQAPDPYMLPKRRAAIASDVDFRRSSGGVRWGRWAVMLLLLTGGVLAAYRQNLLREGARRLGIENKYLHGEQRVSAFVSAKAPAPVKLALTRLSLLPGPNAAALSLPPFAAAPALPATPAAASEPKPASASAESAKAAEPSKPSEPEVKTVSLDSLPVLAAEEPSKAAPVAAAAAPRPHAATRAESRPAPTPPTRKEAPAKIEKPEPVAKAEPKPKPEPKAKPALPPSSANDSPLKAAIRAAIIADSNKK